MVVDLSKTPPRFFLACGMYCAFALIIIMVFAAAFTSGVTFGTPRDFAVDNEQRVYLSMQSGVFISDLGTLRAIWPSTQNGYAPSVSEDDLLTIADSLDVRALSKEDMHMRVSEKGERAVHAEVYYSVQEGTVTGWTVRMEYPEKPKVKNKNSAIEQALLDSYLSLLPKRNSALKKMIPLLAAASGASKRIPGVAALAWYDGALSAGASGERYEDTQKGGAFSAYISMEGTERTLVCTFLFD